MENYFIIKSSTPKVVNIDTSGELLIKKNKPNNLEDFIINKTSAQKLHNIVHKSNTQQGLIEKNIINLFIYGGRGVGKYTLAQAYINDYLGYPDIRLRLETIKTDSKELEYFQGRGHYELILYKYNFNDINLINAFFKKVCREENSIFTTQKNIIVIKNVELIRHDNLYLFKHNIEKYSPYNIFIFISNKLINKELQGFFCNIRIPNIKLEDLNEFAIDMLGKMNIKKYQKQDINHIINSSNGSLSMIKNNLQYSYITGKYSMLVDDNENKFSLIYKLLKKKNMKNLYLVRELLVELLSENITSQEILKYLLRRLLKSKSITLNKKNKIIEIIVKCDMSETQGLRNIIHLEYAFIQIINVL